MKKVNNSKTVNVQSQGVAYKKHAFLLKLYSTSTFSDSNNHTIMLAILPANKVKANWLESSKQWFTVV